MTARWMCAVLLAAGCGGVVAANRRHEADIAACDHGDGPACLRVGRMWRHSAEIKPEPAERQPALVAFDRACRADLVEACTEGAEMFAAGASRYETGHPEVGVQLSRHACDLGDVSRCLAFADTLPVTDPERSARARQACEQAAPRCVDAAVLVWDADRTLAVRLAGRACEMRDAGACSAATSTLALSPEQRERFLAASCDLHTAADCYGLAQLESEDPARVDAALAHYRLACKLDHADACVRVGELRASLPSPAPPASP